jgi:hypothetical protein
MSQLEMLMPAPVREQKMPSADTVRSKLDAVLDQLRNGQALEWSEAERRRWRVIFPQMCDWLPEGERELKKAEFQRLTRAQYRTTGGLPVDS